MNPRLATAAVASLLIGAASAAAAPPVTAQSAAAPVPLLALAADSAVRAEPRAALAELFRVERAALGSSGALRIAVARIGEPVTLPWGRPPGALEGVTYRWDPLFGTPPERIGGEVRFDGQLRAPTQPGFWRLVIRRDDEHHPVDEVTVITEVPFTAKRGGRLNGYMIGTYPTAGSGRSDRYAPPAGFIEVTPETRDLPISRHLRLGQFLTKDQFEVWPKYVALDLLLIDKLELTMQELQAMGVRAERIHIMSGFRTPNYNGPGEGGRALLSRHTFGDAADIWIENGVRTGYIADLNGDGVQDTRDADVIMQAVERVEQRFPHLTGGIGVYAELGPRSPFVHIDVRGARSRW